MSEVKSESRLALQNRPPTLAMGTAALRRQLWIAGLATLVFLSVACAAMGPLLNGFTGTAPTPAQVDTWSQVNIPKPTPTSPPATPAPAPTPTAEAAPEDEAPATTSEQAPAITMVIVEADSPPVEADQAAPTADTGGKYVLVRISQQHLYAYENGQLVFSFVASTGMGNSTRVGSFQVLDKIPNAYGANWNIWMPDWLGIYWSGSLENGIHALPILPSGARLWSGFLGTPISYGCVVLGADEAMQLYDWVDIGTPVEIQW